MKDLIEVNESATTDIVINSELNKYDNKILLPHRLAEANAFIAKYGLPKEVIEMRERRIREQGFWVEGFLCQAEALTKTFWLFVEATNTQPQKTYAIKTWKSDTLTELVKNHWDTAINVHIMPQNPQDKETMYDFIAVK